MQNPYFDSYLGLWKVPQPGDAPPTRESLFPLDPKEKARQRGNDKQLISTAEVQLQSAVETHEPLRMLTETAGPKAPKVGNCVQKAFLQQKAIIPHPSEQPGREKKDKPRGSGGYAADLLWMGGDGPVFFNEASVPPPRKWYP